MERKAGICLLVLSRAEHGGVEAARSLHRHLSIVACTHVVLTRWGWVGFRSARATVVYPLTCVASTINPNVLEACPGST